MKPTKDIMDIHRIKYTWHEFFPEGFHLLFLLALCAFVLKLFFTAEVLSQCSSKKLRSSNLAVGTYNIGVSYYLFSRFI